MSATFKPGDTVRFVLAPTWAPFAPPRTFKARPAPVVAVHGAFRNPESLAYSNDGLPKQFLYLVRFDQTQVWNQYTTSQQDTLFV